MKTLPTFIFALVAVAAMAAAPGKAAAMVILSTDFTGRTVSGTTASNIIWTTNGVTDPGTMTAANFSGGAGGPGTLFNTANAQGYFAPQYNLGNNGTWTTSLNFGVTAPAILLTDMDLGWRNFNNNGDFQTVPRQVEWVVSVTGDVSGISTSGSITQRPAAGAMVVDTVVFNDPILLTPDETWTVTIQPTGQESGNNTAIGSLSFSGTIIPEPSAALLSALGLLAVVGRRRRVA